MQKLNSNAFASAGAVVAAIGMLFLGIAGNIGVYNGAVQMMEQWHIFFSPSVGGIIAGMIEASAITYVCLYLFTWVYNKLNK